MRRLMKTGAAAIALGFAGMAMGADMPKDFWTTPTIHGYGKIHYVADAAYKPRADQTYKIIFALTKGSKQPSEVNPALDRVARTVNLYVASGVPLKNLKFVAVAYGEATPLVRGAEEVDGGERDVGSAELRSLALLAASAPGLWAHTAVLVINGLICGALNTTVPAALKDEFHTDPEFVQYTQAADTALRSLASALLLPLLAVAVREPTRSAILAVALAGSLGLVLGVGEPLWPFVVVNAVAFSLQSVHQSAALAGFNAFVVSRARQLRGLVKGFAFAVFVSGISVGSFAAERVLQAWGREGLWWPLIAAAALCVLLNRFRPFDADKALAAVSSAS